MGIRGILLALAFISAPCGHLSSSSTPYGDRVAVMNEELVFTRFLTDQCFECAFLETSPGKLLAVWLGGTAPGADDIRLLYSINQGNKWSEPKELTAGKGERCWYPSLALLENGEILCFFRLGAQPHAAKAHLCRSTDQGKSWSPAVRLPKVANGPEHPLVLTTKGDSLIYGSTGGWGVRPAVWTEVSHDEGETWELQTSIPPRTPATYLVAPNLFYGNEGRIRAVCSSSDLSQFCLSESEDEGDSWSPAFSLVLPNLRRGIGMATLTDGRLLAVYNDAITAKQKESGLHQVALSMSTDEGKSWRKALLLESRHGDFGSPVVQQTQDGQVHIMYNWKRKNIRHVVLDPRLLSTK